MFFVTWTGNEYPNDPLDKGCESYEKAADVVAFYERNTNKGYKCRIFIGQEWQLTPKSNYEIAREIVGEAFGKHLVE